MSYTFLSAKYSNQENTSALVITSEAGEVLLSETDTPLDWADLMAWDAGPGTITAFTPDYDALRTAKIAELRAYEDTLRDTGATWPSPTGNDKPYRIRMDLGDILNYTALAINAVSAATATDAAHTTFFSTYADPGMTLFSTDTGTVPTLDTKEKALDFSEIMLKAHRDVAAVSYSKQAAILALPDNEATIAAYDVTTGWPVI